MVPLEIGTSLVRFLYEIRSLRKKNGSEKSVEYFAANQRESLPGVKVPTSKRIID